MDKHEIIREIKRTAEANSGKPLGHKRFGQVTGITYSDWFGRHWKNWGDALAEAGFRPNKMNSAYDEEVLITALISLTREITAFPSKGDLLLKRRRDPSFPSHNVFSVRFGSKAECIERLLAYCREHDGLDDVAVILANVPIGRRTPAVVCGAEAKVVSGFVYLVKHGSRREYKIGRTNNRLRREGEVSIELPERIAPVHAIETDDPAGVERYWHLRFADKRKNGEWFELTAEDVRAFRRWRRIF
jgi:hypothetical protein